MKHYFTDQKHMERFADLVEADGTGANDLERISLFYILSGNHDLYHRCSTIYDFKSHSIIPCILDGKEDFSSGILSLLKLGFNLYNGYRTDYMTPMDLFFHLDHRNSILAENAIHLRFNGST